MSGRFTITRKTGKSSLGNWVELHDKEGTPLFFQNTEEQSNDIMAELVCRKLNSMDKEIKKLREMLTDEQIHEFIDWKLQEVKQ